MESRKQTARQTLINRRRRRDIEQAQQTQIRQEEERLRRAREILEREQRRIAERVTQLRQQNIERAARRAIGKGVLTYADNRPYETKMVKGDSINAFYTEIHKATSVKRRFTERALYNSINNVLNNPKNVSTAGWAVISYMDRNTNRPRFVTIDPNYLSTYDDFINRLREIENSGDPSGSGQVGDENYDIQLNRFVIRFVKGQAFGKSGILMFNTENIVAKKKDCAKLSFEKIGLEYNGSTDFEQIKDFARDNGVKIYGNTFKICESSDWRQRETFDIDDPAPLRKGVKKAKIIKLTKLFNSDIIPCPIVPLSLEFEVTDRLSIPLLYCEKSSHIDVVKLTQDLIVLRDDLYICKALKVYKKIKENYIQIFSPQERYKYQHNPSTAKHYYIYFDFETVVDFKQSNQMKPYSLSCYKLPKESGSVKMIESDVKNLVEDGVCESFQPFVGWDCTEQFAKYFLQHQNDEVYELVSFNGSNFDNIILLRELLLLNQLDKYKERFNIGDVFYNGNQLISFRINGRHTMFDLAKYILGSLASACKNFGVPAAFQKKGFDHDAVQSLYDNGELDALLDDPTCDFYKKLVEYNNFDCSSLAYVHLKFRDALSEIPIINKYGLLDNLESKSKTIGSLIWKIFGRHMEDKHYYQPKVSYKFYNDLQRCKVAGRVELFNGPVEIREKMASADICSAYPYEMAINTNWYPVGCKATYNPKKSIEECEIEAGNYVRSSEWVDPPNENSTHDDGTKIAFYYCTFNQSKLLDNNRANIYPQKIFNKQGLCEKNLWETRETLTDVLLPNVTIKRLRDAGVSVGISQLNKGLIFSHKVKNIELFEPILDFMRGKNEQDEYCRTDDPRYNASLRAMYKLLPNSLSGKVTEGLHVEKTQEVDFYTFTMLQEKVAKGELKNINAIDIVGDKVFATTQDYEHNLIREQRPIHLAVLIYSYTHKTMSESLYDIFGLEKCVYTDTDACKVRYADFEKWKEWAENVKVPHWEEVEKYDERYKTHMLFNPTSKVFGSFEDELDKDNNHSWFQAKKQYLISSDTPGYEAKMSFKGVRKSDIIIDVEHALPKFIEKKDKKTGSFYIINNSRDAYDFSRDAKADSVQNNYNKLFSTIMNTGKAHLLCSSFAKNIKNSHTCRELADESKLNKSQNTISLRLTLKNVSGG